MRIVGVIAEYNPFHMGHRHHLAEARRLSGADAVVAVMSGCFTQRGECTVLSPFARAGMALSSGADAVFLLPAQWSIRDAEHFALGGIRLLQLMGVDAVSFGAEHSELSLLQHSAAMLQTRSADPSLRTHLKSGMTYAAALSEAVAADDPAFTEILSNPNDTLGVCYLRAMETLGFHPDVYPVQRTGSYHGTALGAAASASAIRSALEAGRSHLLTDSMPERALAILHSEAEAGRLLSADALDQAYTYVWRTMRDEKLHRLPTLSEGIENRLHDAALTAATREDILTGAKTKRYTYARLSRLMTHGLLDMTEAQLQTEPLPTHCLLLACRDTRILSTLADRRAPIVSSLASLPAGTGWAETERRAWQMWALAASLPDDWLIRRRIVTEP